MGMTIAEKIIAAAAGVDSVKPGDIHTVELDRLMSNGSVSCAGDGRPGAQNSGWRFIPEK